MYLGLSPLGGVRRGEEGEGEGECSGLWYRGCWGLQLRGVLHGVSVWILSGEPRLGIGVLWRGVNARGLGGPVCCVTVGDLSLPRGEETGDETGDDDDIFPNVALSSEMLGINK